MALERTLTIIKPDAVAKGVAGQIVARIEKAGFTVLAARLIHLTPRPGGGLLHRAQGRGPSSRASPSS